MSSLLMVILVTSLAGLGMPLGGLLAKLEHFQSDWLAQEFRHGVMAFGGGALLSAVGLVLVPESIEYVSMTQATLYFLGGSFAFMGLDIWLRKTNTPASQLAAMLADFIPESIALGAAIALDSPSSYLLAGLITLQNIPEGFNAYRELRSSPQFSPAKILIVFTLLALLGPIAGVSGYVWLTDYHHIVSAIMLFASGGILYSIFQDIAPQVKLEKHWFPPMGAVFGFLLGMLGYMLVH
ncbi:MAG: divalent cation transporter [Paraglaciecola sp.]|uniref:ZIP family metal transporter n=1 Tax=Paraglaciecola sp. TaxID=1920173 RepID=UPI00273D20AF|nr:divalent cation transporter [Paraglaciecola sp.]MDP5032974.1 divalent cation transporter [Paraglaciecola sp.]MDP5133657.1 divalent cation transporter [Paraglaciecola sp.]